MTATAIIFSGKMAKQFGRRHELHLDTKTPREAIRALRAVLPGFEKFLMDGHAKGIEFSVWRGRGKNEQNLVVDQLYEPAGDTIRIAAVPAGAKRAGVLQTIIGIVLIVVSFWTGGATLATGISMVAGGVVQMLSPQPKLGKAADASENQASYVFNGPINTTAQGGCVPVAYGRVRVGSAIISAGMEAQDYSSAASNVSAGSPLGNSKKTPFDDDSVSLLALPGGDIAGAKGGAGGHTPVEAPNTLRSICYFHIVDLISEGEIAGLVNGLQSVYLDGTPVANPDGSLNFTGVSIQTRPGTQDQDYIPGYGGVESDTSVNTELKSDSAWVHQLTDTDLSAFRLTLQVDALQKSDTSNGDINGYTVQYAIDVSTDNGAYNTVLTTAFSGKTTGPYQRSHRIDLPAATIGWNVRVRRLTANQNSSTISDTTRIVSITEIIDTKLRYPNSAIVAISGDASQFTNIPSRAYEIFGRKVRIPSNYDPQTRAYNGAWDGSFQTEWTDVPSWVLYDLTTQDRFGLGDLIDASMVDKWELYRIAQYSDELVDDGMGGKEPRYTFNGYLQTQADAFKVLSDVASVFWGVSYWMGGSIVSVADMPQDPIYVYNETNTGGFTYQSSPRKTRYTTAQVTWNDPNNAYGQAVEYVEDRTGLVRYGLQLIESVAFGCTSQGQAHRSGKRAILSSQLETDSVTFPVGFDALIGAIPGRVVLIQDPDRAGARQGGRLSVATIDSITVDREPDQVAPGDRLTVHTPLGVAETREVESVNGRVITVATPFTAVPVSQSVWAVESDQLAMQHVRILNVERKDGDNGELSWEVNALQHQPGKFAAIDSGALIQIPPISKLPTGAQPPPTNVRLSGHVVIEQGIANNVMTIEWDAAAGAASYQVEWQKDNGQWVPAGTVSTTSVPVVGIYTGTYTARVTAFNNGRTPSIPAMSVPTAIEGKTGAPPTLVDLACDSLIFGIRVRWQFPAEGALDTQRTEIWASTSPQRPDDDDADPKPYKLGDFSYPTSSTELHGEAAGTSLYFWGRLVDKTGNIGSFYPEAGAVNGQSSSDAGPILDFLTGKITKSQLGQELLAPIEAAESLQAFIQPPSEWVAGVSYSKGATVSHIARLWLALEDVPLNGPEPGTNAAIWLDIGSVDQTAVGLALQMAQTTLKVEELDGQVQATATKTEAVYAQLTPTNIGKNTDGTIGGSNDLPPTAGFYSQTLAQVDSDHALGKRIQTVQAQFGQLSASVTTQIETLADETHAMASQITTVQATAGAAQASAQIAIQTAASVDGKVSSAITAKVGVTADGKYYQAGWALGVDNSGGTVQSGFYVTVDTFAILPTTAGGTAVAPFIVQAGQVFLNQAFIGTGWITNAMIGNQIRSTGNNSAGQAKWEINKDGGRVVRGDSFTINEHSDYGWRFKENANGWDTIQIGLIS